MTMSGVHQRQTRSADNQRSWGRTAMTAISPLRRMVSSSRWADCSAMVRASSSS
jgi:hypothetical protein